MQTASSVPVGMPALRFNQHGFRKVVHICGVDIPLAASDPGVHDEDRKNI
jgi:hypothetical protein